MTFFLWKTASELRQSFSFQIQKPDWHETGRAFKEMSITDVA